MTYRRQDKQEYQGFLHSRLFGILLLLVMPAVHFFVAEAAMNTGCRILAIGKYRLLFNYLLYLMIELTVYAVTLSIGVSVLISALLVSLFAAVIIYLVQFTGLPLYATDLANIGTAQGVMGNYRITLNSHVLLLIGYLLILAGVFLAWGIGKHIRYPLRRWMTISAAAAAWILMGVYIMIPGGMDAHVQLRSFQPIRSYANNGGLLAFASSFHLLRREVPDGYSAGKVHTLLSGYQSTSEEQGDHVLPNVIVIMDEAFSDLQSVGQFETNEPVLPVYQSLTENAVKGDVYVSVFGGHTANTEYEFLSGDSCAFFPPEVTPYQLYIKEAFPSMPSGLAAAGYQGMLAMHPYKPEGYGRSRVYPLMGFERFLSEADFENPVYVRKYISDESCFDKIIEEYEKAKSTSQDPFYTFVVTMQNHSAYQKSYDNLPDTIRITTEGIEDEDAQRYLNLVHLSDAALGSLIDYFEKQEEPTALIWFGDHEPGLSDNFYSQIMGRRKSTLFGEEQMELFRTPFLIWANYDIPEKEHVRTSMNYLQALAMDVLNMPLTGYQNYLLDLMKDLPVFTAEGYWDREGTYYRVDDESSPCCDRVQEYHAVCYNHLFDVKNRSECFSR